MYHFYSNACKRWPSERAAFCSDSLPGPLLPGGALPLLCMLRRCCLASLWAIGQPIWQAIGHFSSFQLCCSWLHSLLRAQSSCSCCLIIWAVSVEPFGIPGAAIGRRGRTQIPALPISPWAACQGKLELASVAHDTQCMLKAC